jgi:UDP-N-acetyl-D-glucosamine dehydrogenase
MRESPALRLIELLQQKGVEVQYNDPYVPVLRPGRQYNFGLRSAPLSRQTLAAVDAVVIATDHSAYDYEEVVASSRLVIDTRNATRAVRAHRERIILA